MRVSGRRLRQRAVGRGLRAAATRAVVRPDLLAGAVVAAALLSPGAAWAATLTVSTTSDTSGAVCTLRDAITAANNNAAAGACAAGDPSPAVDTIAFSAAFSQPPLHSINLGSALPTISSDLQVQGPGASLLDVHRSSGTPFRIFTISSGTVTISGLKASGGLADGTTVVDGGGIATGSGTNLTLTGVTVSGNTTNESAGGLADGGGIENDGTLHLDQSTVSGNTAAASATGSGTMVATGGGIYTTGAGTLTLDRSTINGNAANGTVGAADPFAAGRGAGIENDGATVTVDRSTVSGNTATATGGSTAARANGGGIFSQFNGSTLTVRRSTISANTVSASGDATENSAFGGGIDASSGGTNRLDRVTVSGNSVSASGAGAEPGAGGLGASGSSVTSSTVTANSAPASATSNVGGGTFEDTIISNPQGGGASCAGTTSAGYNIDDGTSCGFTQATDHQSTDPMIGPALADNGGPTETYALLPGSQAIDQGLSSAGETTDQRELPRPFDFAAIPNAAGGDGSDIGAFELQGTCAEAVGGCPSATPSNAFSFAVKGRKLIVSVQASGEVSVSDAKAPLSATIAKNKKRRLLLKPSSASGGPPTIVVSLLLSKLGKRMLRQKDKVTVKARISFTPQGGLANVQTAKLKIKGKKKN
jgi:hypothetical protein